MACGRGKYDVFLGSCRRHGSGPKERIREPRMPDWFQYKFWLLAFRIVSRMLPANRQRSSVPLATDIRTPSGLLSTRIFHKLQTKGASGTKIWRRISNISASHRRLNYIEDIGSIKLRKMALEVLKWNRDEVRFVMGGKLLCAHVSDYLWSGGKKGKAPKFLSVHGLLVTLGKPNANYRPEMMGEDEVLFPKNTGIRDAALLLIKEKNGRLVQMRVPLHLASCVISCDPDGTEKFEIQEYHTKEAYIFKCEDDKETKEWCHLLRYHAKDLGTWRKRRNALANIMINGMVRH